MIIVLINDVGPHALIAQVQNLTLQPTTTQSPTSEEKSPLDQTPPLIIEEGPSAGSSPGQSSSIIIDGHPLKRSSSEQQVTTTGPPPAKVPRTREDDVKDLLKGGQGVLRKIRTIPTVGKVSFEELTLMISSELPTVQNAALGILERISADPSFNINAVLFPSLLNALSFLLSKTIVDTVIEDQAEIETSVTATATPGTRPFDFLARKAEAMTLDLLHPFPNRMMRIESVVNILRNWSTKEEMVSMIAQNKHFVWGILIPSLYDSDIWSHLTLESYTGLWLVLLQVSSLIPLTDATKLESIMLIAMAEITDCLQRVSRFAYILHPAFLLDAGSTETVKKAIIQFIKVSNQFWRQIPGHCFMLIDFLCRIMSNVGNGGIFDNEGGLRRKDALSGTVIKVMDLMWRFIEQFMMVALGVAFLIDRLLRLEWRLQSLEYRRYSESVLHNVQFGLPDGGYLEICLLTILHCLRRLDGDLYQDWDHRTSKLISWCDSLRMLWFHSPIGTENSSLLTQPVTAASSQPYLVLIRIYAILGHLASNVNLSLSMRDVEAVVNWIGIPMTNKVSQDLLYRPEFVHVADMLLSSTIKQ